MRQLKRTGWLLIAAAVIGWGALAAQGGEIVPSLDDSTAYFNGTTAQAGTAGEIASIEGTGYITLAARFTPAAADLTAAGPVILIECGGTTYGNGLYIAGGNVIFATKGSNGVGGNDSTQTSLNDTDVSDSAAAVTIGPLTAGVETTVYASLNAYTGELVTNLNGTFQSFTITGTSGSANLSGDESVSFLGAGVINAGQMGGLTNTSQGQDPLWDANRAVNFAGSDGSVRGQIFAAFGSEVPAYTILVTETDGSTAVREGGASDTVSFALSDNPQGYPVTILLEDASEPDQVVITPSQIVFDAGNWQASQTVTLTAVDDTLREAREHGTAIELRVQADPASEYFGYSLADLIVTIAENDCEVWGFNRSDFNHDCQLDVLDLVEFAGQWLSCSLPEFPCQDQRPL